MSTKKQFPLRVDQTIFGLLEHWAADEFRSVNGHIEYLLRDALKRSGRLKPPATPVDPSEADLK